MSKSDAQADPSRRWAHMLFCRFCHTIPQVSLFLFAVDQVDIWNIIECFRENGLNTLEADTELNASRVEAIITSIFLQLNKRIPVSRQVDVQSSVNMLLNWLLSAYDRYNTSQFYFSFLLDKYEPPHDKTNKMGCAPTED